MINFYVDKEKCTQCKICVSECPVLIINGKTEYPEIKDGKEENCLKCQHCLAICLEGAISILGKDPKNSIPTSSPIPEVEKLENLMQIRRSIRRFKPNEIDKDLIYRMIQIASYAPTAQNENSVQFTVVDNRKDMSKLRQLTYDSIKKADEANKIPTPRLYLNNYQKVWEEKQIDVIFRNAPHLLITSAPKKGTFPVVDSTIAATYFELLANSNEIGILWDGFAKFVFEDIAPEIKTQIGIPENHEIATVLLFGTPAVKFARSIQNDNPEIKTVRL